MKTIIIAVGEIEEYTEQAAINLLKAHGAQIETCKGINIIVLPECAEIENGSFDNEQVISFKGEGFGPSGEYEAQYLTFSVEANAAHSELHIGGEWAAYKKPEPIELVELGDLDDHPF